MSVTIPSLRGAIAVPGWAKNELWRKARALPSLDLRFADSKSLVDARTGQSLVTFTRASSGTFVGSDGLIATASTNVPRFDHNPTTGESLGLLVEEQRTNLLLRSEEFGTSPWIVAGTATIASNQEMAPNGTLTADLLTTPSGGPNRIVQAGIATTSTTYASSVYVKAGNISGLTFRLFFSGGTSVDTYADFVFALGAFTAINGVGTFTAQDAGGGWFRISCIAASGNNTAWEVRIGGLITTAQTGTTAYLWGAQLEVGAFPTSYIKTEAAAATRSADIASITGTNFSGWYRQDEGTMFAETQLQSIAARTVAGFDINDNSINNRIVFRALTLSVTDQVVIRSASSTVFSAANVSPAPTTASRKSAVGYKVNDFMFTAIGSAGYTGTTGAVPVSVNQMLIGHEQGPTGQLGGTIRRLTFWPQRLPNNVLQAITQ